MSLALSRQPGEGITIGDDIHVKVVAVEGDRVRLAVNAPRSVRILRDELSPSQGGENHGKAKP